MFSKSISHVEKAIAKSNVPSLIDLCGNKDRDICLAAIAGLGSVGGDDASNSLVSQFNNPDPKVRIAVAKALGHLGDMHTKAFVSAQLSKEKDPEVLEALRTAYRQIKDY
ncbi:MAG TPA: HEAT repeat domain-containing protein [Candidatus Limiplasma sp.]|nr:HEAT repeat domain-containing protein [Candidatus Limiplasma sp.]HRX08190.1 HEAT repeat domain-containing protein [Candidatus Limiplasma sp.]